MTPAREVRCCRLVTALAALAALTALAALAACANPAPIHEPLALAVQSRPVVLLGEVHDNAAQHAQRAAALRELLAAGARPALLMEQFDRERQADIDRALARPGVDADAVIAAAAPADAGWNWRFYRPFIALAIDYRLPLLAANVSRADARRASQDGLASIGFEPGVPADIEALQTRAIVDGHCGMVDAAQARRLSAGQSARDQFMARLIDANVARGVVLLAGNGHVRRDIGAPRWLATATRANSVAIGLLESGDPSADAFDRVFFGPPQARPDPCEGLRSAPAH